MGRIKQGFYWVKRKQMFTNNYPILKYFINIIYDKIDSLSNEELEKLLLECGIRSSVGCPWNWHVLSMFIEEVVLKEIKIRKGFYE